jgi:hypothetical protein
MSVRSIPFALVVVLAFAGCQSQGGTSEPSRDNAQKPGSNQANPIRPISQTNNTRTQNWRPDWWFNDASRTSSGSVQACGSATSGTLIDARRQAIDEARARAIKISGEGQPERVIQSASSPNTEGGFTVWAVIELGGQ